MAAPVAESRFPVGSSASTTGGAPATARAIATRCRSPPDSWVGRAAARCASPTRSRASAASRRRSARRTPAYSSPSATLPSTLWCSARKNCWNTNPIRDARSAGQLPVPHPRHVQAGDAHRPGSRLVQGAHQVQQRGLARPRRAGHRHQLPGGHRQARPDPAPAPAATPDTPSTPAPAPAPAPRPAGPRRPGPSPRRSRRRHHDALPGGQRPGHLHQPGGVIEDPGRHRHLPPRVPRADDLHDVPPGRLGQQRRHRHRQHVARGRRW